MEIIIIIIAIPVGIGIVILTMYQLGDVLHKGHYKNKDK